MKTARGSTRMSLAKGSAQAWGVTVTAWWRRLTSFLLPAQDSAVGGVHDAATGVGAAAARPSSDYAPCAQAKPPTEESVNYSLLLTAPDAYFKRRPSLDALREERQHTLAQRGLCQREDFRRQREEIGLPDAFLWLRDAAPTAARVLSASEVARIDAAHAELSCEILLWHVYNASCPALACSPAPRRYEQVEVQALSGPWAMRACDMLKKAELCRRTWSVAQCSCTFKPFAKQQTVFMVPLSAVVFGQLLYVRGWAVTEDNMPLVTHPVMMALHSISLMRRTRRRLAYAPALPPLELDYSFGMDAGRASFLQHVHRS